MATTGIVDCDTHFWEPIELWDEYIEPEFRASAPHLVHDGDRLLMQVGQSVYPSAPNHRGLGATYGPRETLKEQVIWDREVSCDAQRRLEFMDRTGADVHIVFPTLGMVGFSSIDDPAVAAACARAYNRFCRDFASADPRRLRPVMLLPMNHPDVAIEEMRYAREECGLSVAFANPTPPDDIAWGNGRYDDLWDAFEDLDVTLAFHESAVGATDNTIGLQRYAGYHGMAYLTAHTVEPQLAVMDVLLGGVVARHPKLKAGLLEAHLAWLPGWLEMVDHVTERYPQGWDHDQKPSEMFRQHFFVAAFPDDIGVGAAAESLPDGNVVFSSDWPHKSLTEQRTSLDEFEQRPDLAPAAQKRILEENPRLWFDL
ncbi:MAG TPA: amidohydrolase family protein [Acidimicrobiales bacterium]|jgi:predicted TIM-barrel fold metal-dependent hydrolase|nr:amidohydrolase family protein [Acidimicrobiales bacterium]